MDERAGDILLKERVRDGAGGIGIAGKVVELTRAKFALRSGWISGATRPRRREPHQG